MDRRYGKTGFFVAAAVLFCIWKTCMCQNSNVPASIVPGNSDPRGGYFSDLFNMHKVQPVRSYSIYGNGHHNGPYEVEQILPVIKPEKDFKIPPELLQEMLRRHSEYQHMAQAGQDMTTEKSWLSYLSWSRK